MHDDFFSSVEYMCVFKCAYVFDSFYINKITVSHTVPEKYKVYPEENRKFSLTLLAFYSEGAGPSTHHPCAHTE